MSRNKKDSVPTEQTRLADAWQRLLESPQALDPTQPQCRIDAWRALAWAQEHVQLEHLPVPVTAEASQEAMTLRAVMCVLSNPPADVPVTERLEQARAWAGKLRYPLLDALYGTMAAEAGQVRLALSIFEASKYVGAAFPEVPLAAGRALLACAGTDPKLLHKAEWYLMHAEHLTLNGDEEPQDAESLDPDDEIEAEPVEQDLDEESQRRLADTWTLMAKVYARLGDLKKAEMYRTRAGSCADMLADESEPEETEGVQDDLAREEALKPTDRKLIRAFFESTQFRGLSAEVQKQARKAIPTFVALGRQYLGIAPARLDRYSLEELLVAVVPERMVASVDRMALVPPAVIAWIHFLGKNGQLRDAGRLGTLVQRMGADYMANCRNPDHWAMSKTVMMQMLNSGVNIEDPGAVEGWLQNRRAQRKVG